MLAMTRHLLESPDPVPGGRSSGRQVRSWGSVTVDECQAGKQQPADAVQQQVRDLLQVWERQVWKAAVCPLVSEHDLHEALGHVAPHQMLEHLYTVVYVHTQAHPFCVTGADVSFWMQLLRCQWHCTWEKCQQSHDEVASSPPVRGQNLTFTQPALVLTHLLFTHYMILKPFLDSVLS